MDEGLKAELLPRFAFGRIGMPEVRRGSLRGSPPTRRPGSWAKSSTPKEVFPANGEAKGTKGRTWTYRGPDPYGLEGGRGLRTPCARRRRDYAGRREDARCRRVGLGGRPLLRGNGLLLRSPGAHPRGVPLRGRDYRGAGVGPQPRGRIGRDAAQH